MLSPTMEDYLKTIHHLDQSRDDAVRTSEIAEYLEVKSPTVTSMLEKLDEKGFIEREKYRGVELTKEGEKVALEIIRHHRLLEAYLTEHLDYTWSEVHEEAERLEHHISEDFEERVAEVLNDPDEDPHGAPIPSADLEPLQQERFSALSSFEEGDTVIVRQVGDEDPEVLDYLAQNGIKTGVNLEIIEISPIGVINIETEKSSVSLSIDVADEVRVEKVK